MKQKKDFTLIELLIVVAVIAILAGLLLPALRLARENVKRIECLSHLRQYQIGMQTYSDTYHDYLVPLFTGSGSSNTRYWYNLICNTLGYKDVISHLPGGRVQAPAHATGARAEWGVMWLQCPNGHYSGEGSRYFYNSCHYNTFRRNGPRGSTNQTYYKLKEVWKPSVRTSVYDSGRGTVAYIPGFEYYPALTTSETNRFSGGSGPAVENARRDQCGNGRHAGKNNFAFFDGHAASVPLKVSLIHFYQAGTLPMGERMWATYNK